MTTETEEVTKSKPRKSFRDWYAEHKEELLNKRRERYANDPQAREKARIAQATYRMKNPRASTAGQVLHKEINGVVQPVYRIGDAAKQVGRKVQVLRLWERNKWVPEPTPIATHRYYTQHQVKLLKEFAQLIDVVRYQPLIRTAAINTKSVEIWQKWDAKEVN